MSERLTILNSINTWNLFIEWSTFIIPRKATSISDNFEFYRIFCYNIFLVLKGGGIEDCILQRIPGLGMPFKLARIDVIDNCLNYARKFISMPLLVISNIVSASEAVHKSFISLMRILDSDHLMVTVLNRK